jgi:hypothetical protein
MKQSVRSTVLLLACAHGGTRGALPVRDDASGHVVVSESATRSAADTSVSIASVIGSHALVGRRVRVSGRCLGYGGGTMALGGPPRTRSDWQLGDATAAIYVVGPRPNDCDRAAGSPRVIVVRGVVAEDTVRMLSGARLPRRYLVADSSSSGGVTH